MDILEHNRKAWDKAVQEQDQWTCPVDTQAIERAKAGELDIVLTPTKSVPMSWFPPLPQLPTLCLASGGGQQGPLLAAAGCDVVVFDNSPQQLGQDRLVAERDGLQLRTVEGDMADLSTFDDDSFGLIVHPCANCFVPDVLPVWRECHRVLKKGGILMAGFCNPVRYIFEDSRYENGVLQVRYPIPHSDAAELGDAQLKHRILDKLEPMEFGHTLSDQIGGQLEAGFVITGFYEDRFGGPEPDPISNYLDTFIATRAVKP
ncbi:class I SAM-dependent methyltransferase [Aeoliella sp. ICT_H6.2]|uniref:Class I SAM-dependent methyltransferase n=1 Tax=Aeoliella straminimaris TaxID=2954799 RepID=A0A9X2FD48_9BACT|nr:class I SAM-dependent methyltransferase [Aeoliella straminimaris]MCO6046404.1 class I SAM-dependent methyltransferase [Aeoliella straminimaris]